MSTKKGKVGIWAFFGKIGPKLFSVFAKLLKVLKFGKVALAAATFAGYAMVFTWKFALLLMAALAFHESGHVWAMKRMGIKTKGFYFIPFLGGAAIAEERYKTQGQHAFISIMGPVWGCGLALVTLGAYYKTGNIFFAGAAGWMATLNLFNLLPVNPLDGGQIIRCIAFSIHEVFGLVTLVLSLVGAIFLANFFGLGLFLFLFVIGAFDLLSAWWEYKKKKKYKYLYKQDELESIPDLTKGQMALTILSYIGTAAVLLVISYATKHIPGADIAHTFLH